MNLNENTTNLMNINSYEMEVFLKQIIAIF